MVFFLPNVYFALFIEMSARSVNIHENAIIYNSKDTNLIKYDSFSKGNFY